MPWLRIGCRSFGPLSSAKRRWLNLLGLISTTRVSFYLLSMLFALTWPNTRGFTSTIPLLLRSGGHGVEVHSAPLYAEQVPEFGHPASARRIVKSLPSTHPSLFKSAGQFATNEKVLSTPRLGLLVTPTTAFSSN